MVRDPSLLSDAFHIWPEYLKDVEPGEEEVNFADRGVQLTRYSRALKIWVSVNYFGTELISAAIQDAMDRARLLESLVGCFSRFRDAFTCSIRNILLPCKTRQRARGRAQRVE